MTRAPSLRTVGDPAILDRPKVALFCSVKCPGKLILDTYDLCQRLRAKGVTVISGFHSPVVLAFHKNQESKPIIDEIDRVSAKHHGFKYRLGCEDGEKDVVE